MTQSKTFSISVAAVLFLSFMASFNAAQAQDQVRKPARHLAAAKVDANGRPLTIGGRRAAGPGAIVVSDNGNEIYAPGGFSAHGYGWGAPGSEQAERAARNASVTSRSANGDLGLNGIGAYGFGDRGRERLQQPVLRQQLQPLRRLQRHAGRPRLRAGFRQSSHHGGCG